MLSPDRLNSTAENWNGGGYWVRGFSYGCMRVAFLPPNTTALVQPMDAGIIRAFKAHFRRFHLLWVISQLDAMGEGVSADKVLPTVRQAIEWTSKAWACVTKQTVQNCWKHVKILPSGADLRLSDESHDALDQLLVLLEDIARNNTVEDPCTAQEFVSIREENLVEDPECDESWMTETYSAAPEPEDSDAEESGDEVEIVPVSLRQARIGLATALRFFLESGSANDGHIEPMRRAMMDLDSLAISNARVQSSITSFFSPAPSRQEAGPAVPEVMEVDP